MDCDTVGVASAFKKSKEFVNVQRHYESDLCKRNLPQRLTSIKCRNRSPLQIKGSDSCARAQQVRLVVRPTGIPVGVALHESIAIACVPSVSDPNQLLPKPLCLGYLPDVPAPFVHNSRQLMECRIYVFIVISVLIVVTRE